MAPDQPADANRYRISRLEQDVHDLQVEARDMRRELGRLVGEFGTLKQVVADLVAENKEARKEMAGFKKALIQSALAVSGSAVLFAATFWQL